MEYFILWLICTLIGWAFVYSASRNGGEFDDE